MDKDLLEGKLYVDENTINENALAYCSHKRLGNDFTINNIENIVYVLNIKTNTYEFIIYSGFIYSRENLFNYSEISSDMIQYNLPFRTYIKDFKVIDLLRIVATDYWIEIRCNTVNGDK